MGKDNHTLDQIVDGRGCGRRLLHQLLLVLVFVRQYAKERRTVLPVSDASCLRRRYATFQSEVIANFDNKCLVFGHISMQQVPEFEAMGKHLCSSKICRS